MTPDGLDRAALEACVGGAFAPGIEAGGDDQPPILVGKYTAAFRLDHATVAPGALTSKMSIPWQDDFKACGANWWPVARPNDVFENAVPVVRAGDTECHRPEAVEPHHHRVGRVQADPGDHAPGVVQTHARTLSGGIGQRRWVSSR